jgi:hypothetical protein
MCNRFVVRFDRRVNEHTRDGNRCNGLSQTHVGGRPDTE